MLCEHVPSGRGLGRRQVEAFGDDVDDPGATRVDRPARDVADGQAERREQACDRVLTDRRDPAPRSLIATAMNEPPATSVRMRSRTAKYFWGTLRAAASSSDTAVSAPTTDMCMFNTSAVAALPRVSVRARRTQSVKPPPSPPSRTGTSRPSSPEARRSARSSGAAHPVDRLRRPARPTDPPAAPPGR